MQLIDGKNTAELLKNELAKEVAARNQKGLKTPHLAAILVGEDGASQTYVTSKVKSCEQIGFASTLKHLPATITEEELLQLVEDFNQNEAIDGFIVQLPLPNHINADRITLAISPEKDVDGFHPSNIGKMVLGLPCYLPATPFGIVKLLEQYNIETSGKHAVVIGRSNIVGSPMSILLARNEKVGNCTVTLTHSRTKNLKEISRQADIIIAAIGKPEFVTADMVKDGAIVIDVGTTRVPDANKKSGFTLKGDVKFDEVAEKCSFITPVPGGVGPMTVTALLFNTLEAAKRKDNIAVTSN